MNKQTEALRMAIEAMESAELVWASAGIVKMHEAIEACKEALADYKDGDCCTEGCIKCDARKILAETQEPVAWISNDAELPLKEDGSYWLYPEKIDEMRIPLYTTPPSREWQSLSDEEIEELYGDCSIEYFRDIEAKLKEKNG
jgi:hypothetical protein